MSPNHALSTDDNLKNILSKKARKLLGKYKLQGDNIGIFALDLESRKVIADFNSDKGFVPASIVKIPTTLFALNTLGADFQFKTTLAYDGHIKKGVLHGDLHLIGTGDPFFTISHLFNMVMALYRTGIKKIHGKFIYNDSFLFNSIIIDPSGLKDETYNPGVSALSTDFNRLFVYREGKRKLVAIPQIPSIELLRSKRRFDPSIRFEGETLKDKQIWKYSRRQRYYSSERLPVRHPAIFTAEIFHLFAKDHGITLPPPQEGPSPKKLTIVHEHKSKKLIYIIEDSLKYSNNLMAELLLLRSIKKLTKQKLSIHESAQIMVQWFKKRIPYIDWNKVKIYNGSGLSGRNTISPKAITQILASNYKKHFNNNYYWSLLSSSGWEGWLKKRLSKKDTVFHVWAKTGSLDYAAGISGYLLTENKKQVAFAIFVTDFKNRRILDRNNHDLLSHKLRTKASKWHSNIQELQDNLIENWILNN